MGVSRVQGFGPKVCELRAQTSLAPFQGRGGGAGGDISGFYTAHILHTSCSCLDLQQDSLLSALGIEFIDIYIYNIHMENHPGIDENHMETVFMKGLMSS